MTSANSRSGAIRIHLGPETPEPGSSSAGLLGAGFFHDPAWIRVLHDTYRFSPLRIVSYSADDTANAALVLMEVNSRLTGRRGVALPFTDEATPLCSDPKTFSDLFAAAADHGRQRGWNYIECRGGLALLANAKPSTSYHGHSLDLRVGEENLFAQTHSSVRRAVRKAESSRLTLRTGQSLEELKTFYSLLCKTRQRHGLPVQPFGFFANIHRHIIGPGRGRTVLAYVQSAPVAGAVFFHHRRSAIYKFGASDETFQHLRGNNHVMWQAIRWHVANGFEDLDFGRTSLANEGLRTFKLHWGAKERRIDYFRYDLRSSTFSTVRDEASGWHNRFFSRLPVSLSRLAGALLYRHVG